MYPGHANFDSVSRIARRILEVGPVFAKLETSGSEIFRTTVPDVNSVVSSAMYN